MASGYTPWGWVRLAWELGLTRLFQPRARLIRRPFYLRGKQCIDFGNRITLGRGVRIEAHGSDTRITFGDDVQINDYVHIAGVESVSIGHNVLIASRVFISDHNHGSYGGKPMNTRSSGWRNRRPNFDGSSYAHSAPEVAPADRPLAASPVTIGDNVWLGEGVCVLPGVTIGAGSIIGANAVVAGNIPPASIAIGVPARVIRHYSQEDGWVPVR